MKIPRNVFPILIEAILCYKAIRATKYLDKSTVVSAQRKLFNGKIYKRDRTVDIILKIGKPNFQEKKFIKQCLKSGEPLPIKKIQLKFLKLK
jgi:hypothetical protein